MKNWIKCLMVAVLAIGVGVGSVSAIPIYENRSNHIITEIDLNIPSIGIEDSFVLKPGRSGGSFSGSKSSSSSRPSSPSKSSGGWGSKPSTPSVSPSKSSGGWGSSSSKPSTPSVAPSTTTTKSSGSWFGGGTKASSSTSKPVTPANKTASSVDNKVNASTKSTSKSFSTKQSAVAAFKADAAKETGKGGKYTSSYSVEPSVRPSHIPTTYNNHTVVYNPGYGGYGYWSGGGPGLGTWMMYDMLSDAAMLNAMSHHHGYYSPGYAPVYGGGGYVGYIFGLIIGLSIIIMVAFVIHGAFKNNG